MRGRLVETIPYRDGSSDVGALMSVIFFAAVALLFFGRVAEFEPLRSGGASIEGRWIDGFVEPRTDQYVAIYRFAVDDQIYRGRLRLDPRDYGGDGQPVTVMYLPDDPNLSRVLGGEAIKAGDALGLLLALLGGALSLQHIVAYYRECPSWALMLWQLARRG